MFNNTTRNFAAFKLALRCVLAGAVVALAAMGGCSSDSGPHHAEVRHGPTAADEATIQLREELSKKKANHVDRIIARGANVNSVDGVGITPLHLAAMNGHKSAVDLLVSHGARVNVLAGTGHTPLYDAVLNGHEKTVEALLEAGADANLGPPGQPGPLGVAIAHGYNEIAAMLASHGAR